MSILVVSFDVVEDPQQRVVFVVVVFSQPF